MRVLLSVPQKMLIKSNSWNFMRCSEIIFWMTFANLEFAHFVISILGLQIPFSYQQSTFYWAYKMLKFTLKYPIFAPTCFGPLGPSSVVPRSVNIRTLHGTQYTHHNLKYMLPQHCITYNDISLLIVSTKV